MTEKATGRAASDLCDQLGPLPARWYVVSVGGLATLCATEDDARKVAHDCNLLYPRHGPHRAVLLGPLVSPLVEAMQPIAYLYHDAASAEIANPLLHSTLVVMAADRRPQCGNETALVTLAQAQKLVAAERERIRLALRAMDADEGLHNYYRHAAWVLFGRA